MELRLLTLASGEHPDLIKEDTVSHHCVLNVKLVNSRMRDARQEYLRSGFSDEFQSLLGYAFHYIQDLLVVNTTAKQLGNPLLSIHNQAEVMLSRYTQFIPFEAINPISLEGEKEVISFVRKNIDDVSIDPEFVLTNPEKALERSYWTCLSVANAICNNESGFAKGERAIIIKDEIQDTLALLGDRLNKAHESLERTISQSKWLMEQEEIEYARKTRSFIQKLISMVLLAGYRHQQNKLRMKSISKAMFRNLGHEIEGIKNLNGKISACLVTINELLKNDYEKEFEFRRLNRTWYACDYRKYIPTNELRELVEKIEEKLGCEKIEEIELQVKNEIVKLG
jgi:hypothetical protein